MSEQQPEFAAEKIYLKGLSLEIPNARQVFAEREPPQIEVNLHNEARVLDVRDTGDYAAGHIASAKHLPEAQLADRMKELEKFKSRPIIVSCRTGTRAHVVSGLLRKQGFAEAFALRGGIAAWQQASMPLEKKG